MSTKTTFKRGEQLNQYHVLRLELLIRVGERISWATSETVILKEGAVGDMLRLIKRFNRVTQVLTRNSVEATPSSPYASTLGVRLLIDDRPLGETRPEITSLEPRKLDEQLGSKAKISGRFARKKSPQQQLDLKRVR